MRLVPLLAAVATLALAGSAAAGSVPVPALPDNPITILDLVYETSQEVRACLDGSLSLSAGIGLSADPPYLVLSAPDVDPPSPDCLLAA